LPYLDGPGSSSFRSISLPFSNVKTARWCSLPLFFLFVGLVIALPFFIVACSASATLRTYIVVHYRLFCRMPLTPRTFE